MRYINLNGNIYPEHEALLPVSNRAFRYGDGFFESMVMFGGKLPLLFYHVERITKTAERIGAWLPPNSATIGEMVGELALANGNLKNARVRIQYFRNAGGLYLPDEDMLGFAITMGPIPNVRFEAGAGLIAGMRNDCFKVASMVSDMKTSSALMYVLAAKHAKAEGWNECVLTNHLGHVCEGLSSNIFVVKGDKLTTPPLTSGCVDGVMRKYLIALIKGLQLEEEKQDVFVEEGDITIEEIGQADGILMTNAVRGVQWVKAFNGKEYDSTMALELVQLLNHRLV